jgi:hypothetical protein
MGLDTTHGCYNGGYGRFHSLRTEWAKAAGLPPLELMEGFYNPDELGTPFSLLKTHAESSRANSIMSNMDAIYDSMKRHVMDFLPIRWSCLKPDPLYKLLCHSDCEGDIKAKDCAKIANSLEELLPRLPENPPLPHLSNKIVSIRDQVPPPWDVRYLTQKWISGLRKAAAKNQNVEFH